MTQEAKRSLIERLNHRLSDHYRETVINGIPFFITSAGVPFRVTSLTFKDAEVCLVLEYGDTWEDGDLFWPGEMTEDEIFAAMVKEAEDAAEES